MNLFHWQSNGINLLIMSNSLDEARTVMLANIAEWRWQNPETMDLVVADVEGEPLFVANTDYPITIGNPKTKHR